MGKFVVNPEILRAKGNEILNEAQDFKGNAEKVFSTVHEMVNSDYLSPEARAMANKIESYKDDLNRMFSAMTDYGTFCLNASNRVIRNQDDIISGINGGGVN